MRNEVFVDLYLIVRQSLCVGEPSYSIKKVEHLYRGQRDGTVANAGDSIVFYENWLEAKDGETWRDSKFLKDIRDYNQVDCISTLELGDWLQGGRKNLGLVVRGRWRRCLLMTEVLSEVARLADKLTEEAEGIDGLKPWRQCNLFLRFLTVKHSNFFVLGGNV